MNRLGAEVVALVHDEIAALLSASIVSMTGIGIQVAAVRDVCRLIERTNALICALLGRSSPGQSDRCYSRLTGIQRNGPISMFPFLNRNGTHRRFRAATSSSGTNPPE